MDFQPVQDFYPHATFYVPPGRGLQRGPSSPGAQNEVASRSEVAYSVC